MITAVVPSRKGSERVKSKNTREFAGYSLLEVKLQMLTKLKENSLVSEIVVNTDCDLSKQLAFKYNAKYVARSTGLASSDAPITEYWLDVINKETSNSNVMLCQCTSPLISYSTYIDALENYNNKSLISVDYVKDYLWRNRAALNYDYPNHPKSQDLSKDFYRLNFGIVIINKNVINKYKNIINPESTLFSIPAEEGLDIDNSVEFKLAELLYNESRNSRV